MSTKSLKRTVVEGGRHRVSKYYRRYSHSQNRMEERVFLSKIINDPDYADEDNIDGSHNYGKHFADKLGALSQFLKSKIGQPWADVRSLIFKEFDIRTTQGRHIVFDHLLSEVIDTKSGFDRYGFIINPEIDNVIKATRKYYFRHKNYYVDEKGILQLLISKEGPRYSYSSALDISKYYEDVAIWLNGRIIGNKDGKLTWFIPTEGIWEASYYNPYKYESSRIKKLKYYIWESGIYEHDPRTLSMIGEFTYKTHGYHWEHVEIPFSFKQRAPLSDEEIEIFNSFPEKIQEDILKYGKGR